MKMALITGVAGSCGFVLTNTVHCCGWNVIATTLQTSKPPSEFVPSEDYFLAKERLNG